MTLLAVFDFICHPINFTRGWYRSHKLFDRDGYLRDGSEDHLRKRHGYGR